MLVIYIKALRIDCSQSTIFPSIRMTLEEVDEGPPSWFLMASEIWGEYKMPLGTAVEG